MENVDYRERDGYIKTDDRSIYYRIFGESDGVPVLTFHGGPGSNHKHLLPLAGLADKRQVIFYDQFDCGKSSLNLNIAKNPSLWVMENFISEIDVIRQELNLVNVHLWGSSFGTMVIADYLKTKPQGIKSVTFASPCLSAKKWKEDSDTLRAKLPEEIQNILVKHEDASTTDSKEYQDATFTFYRKYVCRLDPWPDEIMQLFEEVNMDLYLTMWGPSEFYPTGTLKDYDGTGVLRDIKVPALYTCGRYDEATPESTAYYQSLTPNADMAVFENSAHLAYYEEPARYVKTVGEFLERAER